MPKERKQQPAKKLAKKPEKEPIEMTSDELLDAVIAPKVAKRLREFVRDSDDRLKPLGSE
ncbi:MAG: hypothetical protein AABN33_29390 [Acidobacteriota bacterium]